MKKLSGCALADLSIEITWEKDGITHREIYFADQLNCWRDIMPGSILENILDCAEGETVTIKKSPGELIPEHDPGKVISLSRRHLSSALLAGEPRIGRFYPQGLLSGLPGIFKNNMNPFRCIHVDGDTITADLNHPMAGIPMTVDIKIHGGTGKTEERGGSCTDWVELALSGPGMQMAYNGLPTDFGDGRSFERRDSRPDTEFYEKDRFVHHIDDQARRNLSQLYKGSIPTGRGCKVLDLMAGWESHFPDGVEMASFHGLGLNINEMAQNKKLTGYSVQDLNTDGRLKFENGEFDAVICSLSVEYLVKPVPVFAEVARILKPGGIFVVAFSNRWFPEKAIRIWEDLHDFEKMGLVTQFFCDTGCYDAIATLSIRGYPRPYEDKYFPKFKLSDPIYAVSGIAAK